MPQVQYIHLAIGYVLKRLAQRLSSWQHGRNEAFENNKEMHNQFLG